MKKDYEMTIRIRVNSADDLEYDLWDEDTVDSEARDCNDGGIFVTDPGLSDRENMYNALQAAIELTEDLLFPPE